MKKLLALGWVVVTSAVSSFALPTLQLDIDPGTYNQSDETTYSTSQHFDLIALLNGPVNTNRTYYISAALEPNSTQTSPPPNGSFKLGNTVYSVANLAYGTPPSGATKTLPTHGEYPTYFTEFAFHFDAAHTVPAYNTADGTTASGSLYEYTLSVDTSPLLAGYSLHFDLYDISFDKHGNIVIDDFAPFSHDAQSTPNTNTNPPPPQVPDNGATWILLGIGLCAMAFVPKMRVAMAKTR